MKIFVVGLPKSGRSTVAHAIADAYGWHYIDAVSWVRSTFRERKPDEHIHQYEDEYQSYLTKRFALYPDFAINAILEMMEIAQPDGDKKAVYVIDGVLSPREFALLFDYKQDVVVFLNRTDNDHELRDHENIGASVMRDYCFWMSAAGLLSKNRWLEYNFRIPGEDSDHIKALGAQNSVFIVKSIKKAIEHVTERVKELAHELSQRL